MGRFRLLWCISVGLALCAIHDVLGHLVIESHQRSVDLTFRILRVAETVRLRNAGSHDVPHIYAALPAEVARAVGRMHVRTKTSQLTVERVRNITEVEEFAQDPSVSSGNVVLYRVPLPVKGDEKVEYTLHYLVGRAPKPSPPSSLLSTPQFVKIHDRGVTVSPYHVVQQQTVFTVPARRIKKVTGLQRQSATSYATRTLLDKAPFTLGDADSVMIHYTLNQHLGFFHSVERRMDISLWGAVSVHERYEFENEAVALSEPYFRGDIARMIGARFGRLRPAGVSYPTNRICFELEAKIPKDAYGLEFYDDIGNVSTSTARRTPSFVYAQLEPRYPVLGGWKADWLIDYRLPTSSVVATIPTPSSGDQRNSGFTRHQVVIPLAPSVIEVFTENVTLSVVFPPGAQNFRVVAPRDVVKLPSVEKEWGWLDVFSPRPAVHLQLGAVAVDSSDHLKDTLQIEYDYPVGWTHRYRKPLGCCLTCLLPFLLYMVLRHVDFGTCSPALEISVLSVTNGALDTLIPLVGDVKRDATAWWTSMRTALSTLEKEAATHRWAVSSKVLLRRISKISAAVRDCSHTPANYVRRITDLYKTAVDLVELVDRVAPNATQVKRWKPEAKDAQLWATLCARLDDAVAEATQSPAKPKMA